MDQERVVAKLIMSPQFRKKFFAAPASGHAEFGLSSEEFGALRRLDQKLIAFLGGGFVIKRFEYLDPAFPRTLALLEDHFDRDVRQRYAAEVPMSADHSAELAAFHTWAHRVVVEPPVRTLLISLADLEHEARTRQMVRRPLQLRRLAETKPVAAGVHTVASFDADIVECEESRARSGRFPIPAPGGPVRLLVWNDEGRACFERLDDLSARLLFACDGTRDCTALVEEFGGWAEAKLQQWLEVGILVHAPTSGAPPAGSLQGQGAAATPSEAPGRPG